MAKRPIAFNPSQVNFGDEPIRGFTADMQKVAGDLMGYLATNGDAWVPIRTWDFSKFVGDKEPSMPQMGGHWDYLQSRVADRRFNTLYDAMEALLNQGYITLDDRGHDSTVEVTSQFKKLCAEHLTEGAGKWTERKAQEPEPKRAKS